MTNLQRIRIEKKMTQKELATRAKVPLRTLQNYEQGAKSIDNAKLETLLKLAITLECGLENIIENKELKKLLNRLKRC